MRNYERIWETRGDYQRLLGTIIDYDRIFEVMGDYEGL